ncbi:TIGR02680 family protein [Actinosynnema pretiosum subsp. pretiosum]|uniref:TIGR02680 family protein n=1 Tax=Actinosynnema pretiosum subsp. pretiosum TaxID=103721 RepID=A0AA45LDL5_9PSEU|nr:Hypothetical protein APASM_0922 [Actinosynnema pretiosum subsp. pretiosum]QUF07345.1 TIGR02680 family protein [Actinosynnema pretiosum subsp. pretiosum]
MRTANGHAGTGDRPRWVPERAGILNVWRYYDEVFRFHRGRLLLRGPNGTGKSKALELLLPFLFDANLRPNRLSTFGTSERTMHWNLMGQGASGTTRVGYVWLEFRLPAQEGGTDRWFTCGARLAATTRTTSVQVDYFTTEDRVGFDGGLALTTDDRAPLNVKDLEKALAGRGDLHQGAADYRTAVRTTLFPGLSEQRYDALITALLQLRTPKLSQRLDPALLSELLSKALPPLGDTEISDLAEGFERLDRQREQLARLRAEVTAARSLDEFHRTYSRRVLRAASATLISATTDMGTRAVEVRTAEAEHREAVLEDERAEALEDRLENREVEVRGRVKGITDSAAYRDGQRLVQLREITERAREDAESRRVDAQGSRELAEEDAEAAATAQRATAGARERLVEADLEAVVAAEKIGLTGTCAEIRQVLDDRKRATALVRAATRSRKEQVEQVATAVRRHAGEIDRRSHAEQAVERARDGLVEARELAARREEARDAVLAALRAELRAWAGGTRELRFPDPAGLAALAESETGVLAAVRTAFETAITDITTAEARVRAEKNAARARRRAVEDELGQLVSTRDLPPKPPAYRTADRASMSGAPLWRLVRFADHVPERTGAAVEAALQASGLLDAWVGSDGNATGHDTFAVPDGVSRAPGSSLEDVLLVEDQPEVPADVVLRLLRGVAYGDSAPTDHPVAIGADGGWRLGNTSGSWDKPEAEHIGALARQRARDRRAVELRVTLDEVQGALADLHDILLGLERRRAVLTEEQDRKPGHQDLHLATRDLERARAVEQAAETALGEAAGVLADREQEVRRWQEELIAVAAVHRLPTTGKALAEVVVAVDEFGSAADTWITDHADHLAAEKNAGALAARAKKSGRLADGAAAEAAKAENTAREREVELRAVEETLNAADHRVALDELAELQRELGTLERERRANADRRRVLASQLGLLAERLKHRSEAQAGAVRVRDEATDRFRKLISSGLAGDSGLEQGPTLDGGVRGVLDAARAVAAKWPNYPHSPKNIAESARRLAEALHTTREVLGGRADLELDTDEEVQVFTATVDGVRVGSAALLARLTAEAERGSEDITAGERELFDQTLTGDTRRHLAERIRQARELVDGMNAHLERVRTASKVAVRLVWEVAPELPAGTKAARDLLLKNPVGLSESEREALHRFFRERVEQARAENTATSWERQLAEVFDYTAWHRFTVKVDREGGTGWQPLTKRLHGALSGGEKAIALHLPLFAAIAAHYRVVPEAPRIILLDEVFVGVDSTNRGQVFGLLAALGLDLVLTSDHEWCTYRQLDGIAVHQLMTGGGDDPVTTVRFVWDGEDLVAEEGDGARDDGGARGRDQV